MKKILIVIISMLILGCKPNPNKLVIGMVKSYIANFPIKYITKAAIDQEESYQFQFYSSEASLNNALNKDRIDIAVLPFTHAMRNIDSGKKQKIISSLQRGGAGIITNKKIENLTQLKGKSIGVLSDCTLDLLTLKSSEKNQLELDIIHFKSIRAMKKAFYTGKITGFSYYVPNTFVFTKTYHVVHWFNQDFPLYPACDVIANETTLIEKKDKIQRFINSLDMSCNRINGYPKNAADEIVQVMDLHVRVAMPTLRNIRYLTRLNNDLINFEMTVLDDLKQAGIIKTDLRIEDIYKEIKPE